MKYTISRFQLMIFMLWIIMGSGILTMPFSVAQFTIRDGWITCLLFIFGALICTVVCLLFHKAFPNKNMAEAMLDAFGPLLGTIVGIWLIIWFFVTTCAIVREFVVFTQTNLLLKTPPPLLGAVMMFVVGIGVSLGLETLGRFGEIITFLAILTCVFIIPLAMQNVDFHLLQPTLADGFTPILRAAILPTLGFMLELMIVLQIAPNIKDQQTIGRDIFILA